MNVDFVFLPNIISAGDTPTSYLGVFLQFRMDRNKSYPVVGLFMMIFSYRYSKDSRVMRWCV